MPITKKQYNNLIKLADDNLNGVVWHVMGKLNDGRELCLVIGYGSGYEKGEKYQIIIDDKIYTLCQKLAVNIDDLQCDYDVDWYMPWNKKDGDIWNTDMAVRSDEDIDYYNNEAKAMIKELNKGTIEVY